MARTKAEGRPLADVTSTRVVAVGSSETLRSVVAHFIDDGVDFVVVGDGSVAGVVSEHDVVRAIHDGADIDEVWAADVMSTDLVTIDGDATVAEAARMMTINNIRHLLILGDRGAVLSIGDVLRALMT